MEEVHKGPSKLIPGCTIVALPYVSKSGFTGATVSSLILGILGRGFPMCKFLFLGDHTQIAARNAACETAIEEGADWVLFVDSDMDFPSDLLPRLKSLDADIACCDMWARNIPSFRTVLVSGEKDSNGLTCYVPVPGGPGEPEGVHDVHVCGMACTLVKRSLLEKMKEKNPDRPWFWSATHGEDATFCFEARELGATIRCDFGTKEKPFISGHWGVCRVAGQDWSRDANNQPMMVANLEMMARMGAKNLPNSKETVNQ